MRHRSPSKADEDAAYRELRARRIGDPCEVCGPMNAAGQQLLDLGEIDRWTPLRCGRRSTEMHHRRKRSSAGALAHPDNAVPSCHDGNMAVEDHPLVARAARMVLREGDPEWDEFSARTWRKARA